MARELHAILYGGQGDEAVRYNSRTLSLLGLMIFLSLSVISAIIFSCGDDNSHKRTSRRRGRGISGIGGDGGGSGGVGGGGGTDGGGGGG